MSKTYRKSTVRTFLSIAILISPSYLLAQTPDVEAKLKSVPQVTYPAEASKTGLEGKVTVVVHIDETGKVTKVNEVFGPNWVCPNNNRSDVIAMHQIAQKAAERAVFGPAMKGGKPVATQMRLNFDFKNPSPKKQTEGGLSAGGVTGNVGLTRIDRVDSGATLVLQQASTATTETGTISAGAVLNGKAVSLPKPLYPAAARAVKATGTVDVQVIIDTDGTIFNAEPISGHPLLRASARIAACSARFTPTLLSGEPVMVSGIIKYNFVER